MGMLRPVNQAPVVLQAGVWSDGEAIVKTVTLTFDRRLLDWYVNKAVKTSSGIYRIQMGTPPAVLEAK